MEKRPLHLHEIVQINPDHKFAGSLVVVTEPKEWGAQGCIFTAHEFELVRYKGRAFVRVNFEDIEPVGHLHWAHKDDTDDTDNATEV